MPTGNYQYQSDFARKYVAEGKAIGLVEALLAIFESRGLVISRQDRRRIEASTDIGQINAWIRKAVSVASVDDLFRSGTGQPVELGPQLSPLVTRM